jgi:osmoprotectant transport system permease protein
LAAFVGGGGLGGLIVTGLRMLRNHIVLAGAVPAALLALLVDFLLGRLEEALTPEGIKINQ